uniref:Uncharacterized protein n=2 Tax=Kalmanozyma brasiliensis (strain GHG001) TaxID=1365824 RepID=V5E3D2_KALBG
MSISSIQTANKPAEYYKVLRYCLSSLSKSIVQEHGAALHLMPRLTEAVLALVEAVPAQAASNAELIGSLTSACTWLPDERARRAVMQVLDRLESLQGANAVDDIRGKVIRQCIASIERSVTTTSNKSASSKQFVNIVMMDRLLQHDYGTDADLKRRALRGSIIVAGNAEDFHRTWRYFRAYEQYKQGHGLAITGFDLQLLSKALARSQQGRKDAWRIFLQAERLLHSETDSRGLLNRPVSRKDKERDLMGICLDLLGVMSRSGDVRVSKIFSMLGITANDRDDPNVKASSKMNDLSKAMLQSRRRVHAYSVAMQGMLLRKKSHCALAIWQAMLMRGVLPNAAALSLLLQNLFGLGEVKTAMQQLHLWCEQGVAKPAKTCDNLKEIEVPSLVRPALADLETFQPGALSAPTSSDATIYKVTPDTILATVVFNGLQACGAKGVDALWEAYQQTIHLFPDAPVLAMLLKASCRDEGESGIDARFGREVFRTLLFNKHPELAEYENPLRAQLEANGAAGWILSGESVGDRVEQWLASVFRSKHAGPSTMTVPTADLSALSFTSELFEHYLRLLLHLQHSTGSLTDARTSRRQLVDLLGWMKELNIQPSTTHVALTVLEIEEHLPPPVAARQMAVLDAWLIDWLGERGSPEQHVMQRHWRWKMKRNESTKRNGSRKSWFDKVSGGRKPEWEKCS